MLYKFSRLKLNLKQEPIVPSQNQVIIRFALKQIKEKGRIKKKKTHRHCSNKKLYKPALRSLSCIFSPIQSYWQQSHISSARSWSRGIIKKQRGQNKILHSWIRTKGHMLLIQYSGPFAKIQTFEVQPEDNILRWACSFSIHADWWGCLQGSLFFLLGVETTLWKTHFQWIYGKLSQIYEKLRSSKSLKLQHKDRSIVGVVFNRWLPICLNLFSFNHLYYPKRCIRSDIASSLPANWNYTWSQHTNFNIL